MIEQSDPGAGPAFPGPRVPAEGAAPLEQPRWTWSPPAAAVAVEPSPWWSYGSPPPSPPSPPSPPRRRGAVRVIAALAAAAVLLAGAGTAAWRVADSRLGSASPRGSSPIAGSFGSGQAVAPAPADGGGAGVGASGGGPSGSGDVVTPGGTPVGDLQSAVVPAIVDITNTLADGSGQAAGTGMVITASGDVLTNNHVIEGAGALEVVIGGQGASHSATVLGTDPSDDVAVIHIVGVSGLKTVAIGDSSGLSVGQSVTALGNALGRGGPPSVVTGTITALDQAITAGDGSGATENLTGLIQTDARIQPGDSGGPLVDSSNRVIGMDTAASVTRNRRSTAPVQAFAIPSNAAVAIAQRIERGDFTGPIQRGVRPLLGVQVQDATRRSGALVVAVTNGGPAAAAGIVSGDVLTGLGGATVSDSASLGTAIRSHQIGDRVTVTWVSTDGQQHRASVTLASGPPA